MNTVCVDCGGGTYVGGLRCWPCFVFRCDWNQRIREGQHVSDRPVGASAYQDGCKCGGCRKAHADARLAQRRRKAAA